MPFVSVTTAQTTKIIFYYYVLFVFVYEIHTPEYTLPIAGKMYSRFVLYAYGRY